MKKIFAVFAIAVIMFSFTACKKEPVIGYEPQMPQGLIDETERQKNSPTAEIVRTADFDGIWKHEATDKYYYIYNGIIFLLDRLDAGEEEYEVWGNVVAVQTVEKVIAEKYDVDDKELESEDVFTMYISGNYSSSSEGTTVVIGENRTKTVTNDGKEYIFKLIRTVDDWPEGYYN